MYTSPFVQRLVGQEEIGKNGTPHIQGAVEFKKKVRPLSVFRNKSLHWEVMKGTFQQSVEYCTKDSTRAEGGKQWFRGCQKIVGIPLVEPRGWQLTFLARLETMKTRKIYWYWDAKGNKGKSALLKYLVVKHGALCLAGKTADMKYGVSQLVEKGMAPKLILIDVPRACQGYVSYAGIEEVSNGCFFSSKYESGMCVYADPIMVVFSNCPPDQGKMSEDRWDITDITFEDPACEL